MLTRDAVIQGQILGQVNLGIDVLQGIHTPQANGLRQGYLQFPFLIALADSQVHGQWPCVKRAPIRVR